MAVESLRLLPPLYAPAQQLAYSVSPSFLMPHSATYSRWENSNRRRTWRSVEAERGESGSSTYPGDLRLRNPPETGVQVQVLHSGQELVDGVELRAVAHVLVNVQDLSEDAAEKQQHFRAGGEAEEECLLREISGSEPQT